MSSIEILREELLLEASYQEKRATLSMQISKMLRKQDVDDIFEEDDGKNGKTLILVYKFPDKNEVTKMYNFISRKLPMVIGEIVKKAKVENIEVVDDPYDYEKNIFNGEVKGAYDLKITIVGLKDDSPWFTRKKRQTAPRGQRFGIVVVDELYKIFESAVMNVSTTEETGVVDVS